MASLPVREDVSASPLVLTVPGPITGDPWTYLSSQLNAALAVAGAYESLDEANVTDVYADLTASPQYQLALASLERDLELLDAERPTEAAERRRFVLNLFAARIFLGGTLQHRLMEARDAA